MAQPQLLLKSARIIRWTLNNSSLLLLGACTFLSCKAQAALAAPLIDFTAPVLIQEFGGKESHIYPWGSGADQRRATRSGMGYIVFTGNGRNLTKVSAVFGFTSKETGQLNVGGPENFSWFLRIDPIAANEAGTWTVEDFWNQVPDPLDPNNQHGGTAYYTPSTKPGALDRSFTTATSANSPVIGTFLGVNLRKVTVDATSSNYTLANGQLYRLVLIPWTQEPIPPGCTSANPDCFTFLVALPALSFARNGGIGSMDSYYQTLLEYRSYGTTRYGTSTQWYGGKNSLIGLEGPNWAYHVEVTQDACADSDGGVSASVAGTVTAAGATYADYCATRTTLVENYCNGDTQAQQPIACTNACAGGKCL